MVSLSRRTLLEIRHVLIRLPCSLTSRGRLRQQIVMHPNALQYHSLECDKRVQPHRPTRNMPLAGCHAHSTRLSSSWQRLDPTPISSWQVATILLHLSSINLSSRARSLSSRWPLEWTRCRAPNYAYTRVAFLRLKCLVPASAFRVSAIYCCGLGRSWAILDAGQTPQAGTVVAKKSFGDIRHEHPLSVQSC